MNSLLENNNLEIVTALKTGLWVHGRSGPTSRKFTIVQDFHCTSYAICNPINMGDADEAQHYIFQCCIELGQMSLRKICWSQINSVTVIKHT